MTKLLKNPKFRPVTQTSFERDRGAVFARAARDDVVIVDAQGFFLPGAQGEIPVPKHLVVGDNEVGKLRHEISDLK